MSVRVLTGITTTGIPHLGNYAGAIRPAVAASRESGVDAFYFLADYHALIKCDDPARIAQSRLSIAATWLACGLDAERATFYRQSDIPETTELNWLLTCVAGKGLLNRAHAYKAAVTANVDAGQDADAGVTMGLYSYPVLMAADILLFNAHRVPVGRDQIQHVEMARDIAQRFNHVFGKGRDYFTLPDAVVDERNQGASHYLVDVAIEGELVLEETGVAVTFIPGMTATVDIITGHKSVLDYLLKPVLKARTEAMRER